MGYNKRSVKNNILDKLLKEIRVFDLEYSGGGYCPSPVSKDNPEALCSYSELKKLVKKYKNSYNHAKTE